MKKKLFPLCVLLVLLLIAVGVFTKKLGMRRTI